MKVLNVFLFSGQIRKKNFDRKKMFAALNQSRPEPIQRSVKRKDELLHSKARKELSWSRQELCDLEFLCLVSKDCVSGIRAFIR